MPVTTNRSFCIPNTGDLPAAWGTSAINPDFQYLDTMFGGVSTITLSAATTITLTVPPTTGTSSGANYQSNNALIRFTGTQAGTATINFTLPGFYIIENLCTSALYTFPILLKNVSGGGNFIAAQPGKKQQIFFDGTSVDFVNMPDPATAWDYQGSIAPVWIAACSPVAYLLKNGAVYSTATYPALSAALGSTYGGNGVTTFGVPDELNRFRLPVASGTTATRVTAAISGINGTTVGSAGGDQSFQAHTHTNTLTDPGHVHPNSLFGGSGVHLGNAGGGDVNNTPTPIATTSLTVVVNTSGVGGSQNMPPSIVSFLPFIKT